MVSPTILPRMIHPAGFKEIQRASDAREIHAKNQGGKAWSDYSSDLRTQQEFIELFRQSFSVSQSLKILDVSRVVYARWRSSSIWFVQAFNQAIEDWGDEILTSAAVRARGQLMPNEETASGYAEDASGAPVYYNADTRLTLAFLKAMHPEQFNDKLDLGIHGGLNNTNTELSVEEYKQAREEMLKHDDC